MITKLLLKTKPFFHFYFSVYEYLIKDEYIYFIYLHSGLDERKVLFGKTNNFIEVLRMINNNLILPNDTGEEYAL